LTEPVSTGDHERRSIVKRKAALLTIAAAAVTSLGLAAPALAAETNAGRKTQTAALQNCPVNSICGWSGANFTGAMKIFPAGPSCSSSSIPIRSIANTFPAGPGVQVTALVYSGAFCSGTPMASVGGGQRLLSLPYGALSVAVVV
jgi:hypothetical protein